MYHCVCSIRRKETSCGGLGGGRKEGGETEMPRPTMMKLQGLFWDKQSGDSLAFVSRLVDDNHFITLVAPTVRPFLYALSPLLD